MKNSCPIKSPKFDKKGGMVGVFALEEIIKSISSDFKIENKGNQC